MLDESPYATSYMIAIVMLIKSVTIFENFSIKMCIALIVTRPRSNVNMPLERQLATFYLLVIAMFALSVTVYKIISVEICMTLILNFRMGQGQMLIRQKVTCDFLC